MEYNTALSSPKRYSEADLSYLFSAGYEVHRYFLCLRCSSIHAPAFPYCPLILLHVLSLCGIETNVRPRLRSIPKTLRHLWAHNYKTDTRSPRTVPKSQECFQPVHTFPTVKSISDAYHVFLLFAENDQSLCPLPSPTADSCFFPFFLLFFTRNGSNNFAASFIMKNVKTN
mgnify:CR=1 FL=1